MTYRLHAVQGRLNRYWIVVMQSSSCSSSLPTEPFNGSLLVWNTSFEPHPLLMACWAAGLGHCLQAYSGSSVIFVPV
jgi:hypothetical protein